MTKTINAHISYKPFTEEQLLSWLKSRLTPERFHHSQGALQKGLELARMFQLPQETVEKIGLAALLHDCAKLMSPEKLLAACEEFDLDVSPEERDAPQTLHPFVGADLVRREFGIQDPDVLNAIQYHTTGRPGMSLVEKIVYIADKIEENTRNPLYTDKIKKIVRANDIHTVDLAVLFIMNSTITFLIEKGQMIHPRTIAARNELVKILKSLQLPTQQTSTLNG